MSGLDLAHLTLQRLSFLIFKMMTIFFLVFCWAAIMNSSKINRMSGIISMTLGPPNGTTLPFTCGYLFSFWITSFVPTVETLLGSGALKAGRMATVNLFLSFSSRDQYSKGGYHDSRSGRVRGQGCQEEPLSQTFVFLSQEAVTADF
jgi:hypothetical protein